MRFWEVFETTRSVVSEDGKIIPNVNTTCDVQPGETERQAAKFGNKLLPDGTPPTFGNSDHFTNAKSTPNEGQDVYGKDGTRKR
jgi:hypothetical protein